MNGPSTTEKKRKKGTSSIDRCERGEKTGANSGESLEEGHDTANSEKTAEFRTDARIWGLYLREAEERAKARAEVWATGVDSLLLFAGLFAGVVSAFLIESRKKLQLEDQEALLQDIRNALRESPSPAQEDYKPNSPTLWINGLWFVSLLITLFSAILGILAKPWLARYVKAATREESPDAYRRWMLDRSTNIWRMERVITVMPLLVQLAFFLFAAGLCILVFNDNRTMGGVVLGTVGLGTLVYLLVTVLPLFVAAEPFLFPTPLTVMLFDLLILMRHWIIIEPHAEILRQATSSGQNDPTDTDVLADIWRSLIVSPKPDYVDEAIAEFTKESLNDGRLEYFANESPRIALERLETCMSIAHQDLAKRNDILSNNLLGLSQFISWYERREKKPENLHKALQNSLTTERPLSRWNFFPESVRPLAFSIRVPLLLEFGKDLGKPELEGEPWEQLASSLLPRHRFQFMLAACRALVRGKENLKKFSSLSIAFCTVAAFGLGKEDIEWSGLSNGSSTARKDARELADKYLARLFSEIAASWKDGPADYLKVEHSGGSPDLLAELDIDLSGFPRSLWASLTHPDDRYRQQAARLVVSMANEEGDVFACGLKDVVPALVGIAISDGDKNVRKAATMALHSFVTNGKHAELLEKSLSTRIQEQLKDGLAEERRQALDLLSSFADNVLAFEKVLRSNLDAVVAMALTGPESQEKKLANALLDLLAKHARIQDLLEVSFARNISLNLESGALSAPYMAVRVVHTIVSLNKDPESELFQGVNNAPPRGACMRFISVGHSFQKVMGLVAKPLVAASLQDSDCDVRKNGRAVISLLLEREPTDGIRQTVLSLIEKVAPKVLSGDSGDSRNSRSSTRLGFREIQGHVEANVLSGDLTVQFDAIGFAQEHYRKPHFEATIKSILPHVVKLILSNNPDDLQALALKFVNELIVEDAFKPFVDAALPSDLRQYDKLGRRCLVQLLGSLILEGNGQDRVRDILDLAIADEDMDVRDTALEALVSLCDSASPSLGQVQKLVGEALPSTVDLAPGENKNEVAVENRGRARVVVYLMRSNTMRDACCGILHSSLSNIQDLPQESSPACSYLEMLSQSRSSPNSVHQSIREAALETLLHMLLRQEFQPAWDTFEDLASDFLVGENSTLTLLYLRLMTRAAAQAEYAFNDMPKLVSLLMNVPHATVEIRWQALKVLEAFGRREAEAIPIVKALKPQIESMSGTDWVIRMNWAKLLGTLAKNVELAEGVAHLVVMGVKDADSEVRQTSLETLTELARHTASAQKHSDNILKVAELGQNLGSISNNSSWRERLAWANLLFALCKNASSFDAGRQKLIDMVVGDEDGNVRDAAYEGLGNLASDAKRLDMITRLAKSFESALQDPRQDKRSRAVDNLKDCLKEGFKFGDVVKALAQPLLKVALADESHFVRAAAVDLLIAMNERRSIEGINSTILSAVVNNIIAFTETGKTVALRLIEAMPSDISEEVLSTAARTVTQQFKHNDGPTRMSALEILALLYKTSIASRFIRGSIPDVVALALNDNDEEIRRTALTLLIELCNDENMSIKIKINAAQPQLMLLLDSRYLRPAVVELLSLLSQDIAVRRSVASWVISSVTGDGSAQLEGIMELLSSLIIEKRFGNDLGGSDYLLLFLASAVVLKPSMAKFRSRLKTSLWCNYRHLAQNMADGNTQIPESLVNSFMRCIFGRHVTSHELEAWMKMKKYLPLESTGNE